nr:helix-turn-helix transcriptional regulator [uncultured Dysosmobacter sp.]
MSIRKFRERKGWRQEDLAKKIGVDQGAVSKWECGVTTPYEKHAKKMARMFGCTVDELLKEE